MHDKVTPIYFIHRAKIIHVGKKHRGLYHSLNRGAGSFHDAFKFSSTRSVCVAMSPSTICCVRGSSAIWPDRKTKPFALMACEYGRWLSAPDPLRQVLYTILLKQKREWVLWRGSGRAAIFEFNREIKTPMKTGFGLCVRTSEPL